MKNVIFYSAFFLSLAASLVSCSGGGSPEIEYFPVQSEKDADWGMIGPDGKYLFKEKFQNRPTIAINGFFTVAEDDGISVYTATETPKVVGDLEGLSSAGIMSEGMIPVTRNGERITYCDKEGNTLFTLEPYKGNEIVSVNSMFHDGLAIFSTEAGLYGAINTKGEVVVEPKYSSINFFSEGYAGAYLKNRQDDNDEFSDDNKTGVILNKQGEQVAKIKNCTLTSLMKHGLISGTKGERCGFFDKDGEFKKMPDRVKAIGMFNERYFVYRNDDYKYGVMNMDGDVVIRAKYESIEIMPSGDRFLCKSDKNKAFIVNIDDEREATISDVENVYVLKTECETIDFTTKFEILAGNDNEYYFYNLNGEKITKTDLYDVSIYFNRDVDSDYCDIDKAVAEFIKPLSSKGYDNVNLGASLAPFMTGDPEDYVSEDKYYFPELKLGYRYYISGYAYTDGYLATREPVYQTYSYGWGYSYQSLDHYDYSWNASAFADWIHVELTISSTTDYKSLSKPTVKAIKDKGYTEERSNEAYTVLHNGNTYLLVSADEYSSTTVRIDMYSKTRWERNSSSYLSAAISRYNEINDGANVDEDFETAVVEEAVAVEEVAAVDSVAVAE